MTGRGIDRHLLGLRHLRPLNCESSTLFEDDLFERSSRWKLSMSFICRVLVIILILILIFSYLR